MPGSERRDFSTERTLVVGGTGSGKSELAGFLTRGCSRLLVYDTNMVLGGLVGSVVVTDPSELTYRRREVFQPQGEAAMDADLVNTVFRGALDAGHVMVWVDEASSISTSSKLPPAVGAVLRQGRAKGVGVIALTQRDLGASHREFFAQAQHLYVGHSQPIGLETLIRLIGPEVEQATRFGYGSGRFLFWQDMRNPRVVGPCPLGSIRKG